LIAANLALYVFFAKKHRMTIGIIATTDQKDALLTQGFAAESRIEWMDQPTQLPGLDAVIDLINLVDEYPSGWYESASTLLFINQVEKPIPENWPGHFIRFNGWPGFWERSIVEASIKEASFQSKAESILAILYKKTEWVADLPGFLSARILASIINEAYLTFGEGVSSKEDIDTAMTLGTNYPLGPFAWCEKIGKSRIYLLLNQLSANNQQYQPAYLLKNEAGF